MTDSERLYLAAGRLEKIAGAIAKAGGHTVALRPAAGLLRAVADDLTGNGIFGGDFWDATYDAALILADVILEETDDQ